MSNLFFKAVCGVCPRVVARICHQLRGNLHHILVDRESRSSRGRSTLGLALWSTERELPEALGHIIRACDRKAAALLAPSAEPQEARSHPHRARCANDAHA